MLQAEALWIGEILINLPTTAFPIANIGSQTARFREHDQPWVNQFVFKPLAAQGKDAIHVDIQEQQGVDVVADVLSPTGSRIIANLEANTLLCSNLLEHVADPIIALKFLANAVPVGGHLIVTGPHAYPHHPDPIDNGFRPSPAEVAAEIVPDFNILTTATIEDGRYGAHFVRRHGWSRMLARFLTPFYRPRAWWEFVCWVPRQVSVFCVHAIRIKEPHDEV